MRLSEEFRTRSQVFYSYAPEGYSDAPVSRLRITREPDTEAGFKEWSIDVEYRASAIEDGGLDSPVRETWVIDPAAPAWRNISANQVLDIAIDAAGQEHGRLLKEYLGLHYLYEWERHPITRPSNMPMVFPAKANNNLAARLG
ncbi:MAG TPA: hypothetical protein VIN59_09015 [Alphaproteobacteria bacterium]